MTELALQETTEVHTGLGSVRNVPWLPEGFTEIFESRFVVVDGLRLHAVIGGEGPPLLLLCGWPQSWYIWRNLMLPLASQFSVIAADPRGVGLSDKPEHGYDSTTLANDMFALMSALGQEKFAMVGHDIGMWIGYAMAADHPERIERIVLGEAIIPGISDSPPLLSDDRFLSDLLWHFNFNRALGVNEKLVRGREHIYFGHQFDTKAASPEAMPVYAREFYYALLRDPEALRASFDYYRAIDEDIPQFRARKAAGKLAMPVLAFAGARATGDGVEKELRTVAEHVESVILDCGHYPAEEKPEELLSAVQAFLAPYAKP